VKDVTGRSTCEWIDAAVAVETQALLHDPDLSVQQVANELSFPDQSSFGKFFKNKWASLHLTTAREHRHTTLLGEAVNASCILFCSSTNVL
jgi:AraC-like DNA-binding protein